MAAYRFSAKMIKRSEGRTATAAAAYRSGEEIINEQTGEAHDYRRRSGVLHAEIILPDGAPAWMADRARLWNAVEQAETRSNAQLAREIQMNIPHELDNDARRALVREFVQEQFVSRGMVADIAIHAPHEKGDERNHHSHVMLTTRGVNGEGFNKTKTNERDWNKKDLLQDWREQWAKHQNRALERAGLDVRVDHRSYEEQGIDREPEPKLGPVATKMEREGRESKAGNDLRDTWVRNSERERREMQEIMLELQIAQEEAMEGRAGSQPPERPSHAFQSLYDAERASLQEQAAVYQVQIEELSTKLENRNRISVFWDKLRGRLGWNAELELQAARQDLDENRERAEALQASYKQHTVVENGENLELSWNSEQKVSANEFREQQMRNYLERYEADQNEEHKISLGKEREI